MKKQFVFLGSLLFSFALLVFSCKKDSDDNSADVMTSEDIIAQVDYDEASDLDEDEAVERGGGGGACPVVTFANPIGTFPNTVTVDYGTACTRPDGRVLSGKIIISQTAQIFQAGAVRTVSFDNFFMDGVKVEGAKTLTNNGLDASGIQSYTKTNDKTLTFPDGSQSTWSGSHTRRFTEGRATPLNWLDDVWEVTGSGSGTNRDGQAFAYEIKTPLQKKAICRWVSKGVIEFTRNGNTRTLDFGDGSCDRDATLTLPNGDVLNIKLRK